MMSRWLVAVNAPEGTVLLYLLLCVRKRGSHGEGRFLLGSLRVKPIKMEKLRSRFAFARYARLEAAIVNIRAGRFPFVLRETSSSRAMRDETAPCDASLYPPRRLPAGSCSSASDRGRACRSLLSISGRFIQHDPYLRYPDDLRFHATD